MQMLMLRTMLGMSISRIRRANNMKVNNKTRDEIGSLCQKIADLSELIGEIRDAEQEQFDSRSDLTLSRNG